MNVTIKGNSQELLISTVSIVPESDTNALHKFLCIHCATMVTQYQGQVVKIYPILEPYDRALVISSCKYCNSKYTFQTHAQYEIGATKVILEKLPTNSLNYFFCFRHRGRPLINYGGTHIMTNTRIVTIPFSVRCDECEQGYYFSDLV